MGDPKLSKVETGAKLSAQLREIGAGLIRDHIAPGIPDATAVDRRR